ncbi:MAG: CehA/McbA family metallohydrolase [Myxococcales bacterium]|nr:CehA/McbA family metallohydrolase [Myxococcales bacterium]MCB9531327.1 CehA/McbA family metallohydrolase [Myxococcales bacterium]
MTTRPHRNTGLSSTNRPRSRARASWWIGAALLSVGAAACGPDDGDKTDADADVGTPDVEVDATDVGDVTPDTDDVAPDSADVPPEEVDAVEETTDVEPDAPEPRWPVVERTSPQADVDPTAWDPMDEAPAGTARGGVVRDDTFPFIGPEARCRPGDFVIANEHIRACVAATSMSQVLYGGGNLVDLAPAGVRGPDTFELLVPASGLRAGGGDEVELIADGSDGGPAVIRQRGVDVLVKLLGNIVGNFTPDPELFFETEFRLEPGASSIEVVTWVRHDRAITIGGVDLGDLVMPGDLALPWTPGVGVFAEATVDTNLYVASSADFAYAVFGPTIGISALAPGLLDAQVNPLRETIGPLRNGEDANYTRYITVGRDTRDVWAAMAARGFAAPTGVEVTLHGPVGDAFPDRRYAIANADGDAVELVRLGDDGTATVTLPPGDYTAEALASLLGEPTLTVFTAAEGASVELDAPTFGLLSVTVSATDAVEPYPSPAMVRISGPTTRDVRIARGVAEVPVIPGTYTVEVSRGDEFSYQLFTDLVAVAGDSTPVTASLDRVWDTTGLVSADFHQHQLRSVDSSVTNDNRVLANLAAGVDVISPSDHDAVDDFVGLVAEMGVGDLIYPITCSEISPTWGHMNAIPTPYVRGLPAGGAVQLSERFSGERTIRRLSAPELIDQARSLGAEVIQVNHPRDSIGLFASAEYDPIEGPTNVDAFYWPDDFDTMEIYNSPSDVCVVMRDWFSFLSRGMRIAGVGNSDTHSLSSPSGTPRNFLRSPTDDPAELTDAIITDSLLDLDTTLSAGLLITLPGGPRFGETVAVDADAVYSLPVRVQSNQWSHADTLVVYVNGVEAQRIELTAQPDETVVDAEQTIELPISADSYVVVLAYGNTPMRLITPGLTPFALTNPVFFDVGGDGWTAPGVSDAASLPEPTGIPICR